MGEGVEQDGEAGLTEVLAVGEIASVKRAPLFCLTDMWGPRTREYPLSATAVRV